MKKLILVALVAFLSACGPRLSGTYSDSLGLTSLTFKSGGKVAMQTMGVETETGYEIEDGQVKIGGDKAKMVLKLLEDGSLQGPLGMKLVKHED
ncbi:MAG TPA: hypothetical protein VFM32_09480 [Spongiibacteraceae bacterium]|nr:hypothetical protein [Spongiibacteraceae bacterium]